MSHKSNRIYEFGPYQLDARERLLQRDGVTISLTPKAFDLLLALVERHGRLVEKEELFKTVWPDTFVEETNLSYNISHIRKALGDGENGQKFIETVPKSGYRFTAAVREVREEGATAMATEPFSLPASSEMAGVTPKPDINIIPHRTSAAKPSVKRKTAALGAFGLLLLCLMVAGLYQLFNHQLGSNSLVVLPFANGSDDPQAEYLSDGITESLINNLSQLPNLKVIARTTAFRYKGKEIDLRQVGSALGVRAILTGRVAQRADSLVVQADLVDAADGSQLWGQQYNRRPSDLFAVLEEISKEVVKRLQPRLGGEGQKQLTKRYTENTEAYYLYLKGLQRRYRGTPQDIKRSIEYFEQAIAKDPNYALAFAGLSNAYNQLPQPPSSLLSSREAAPKAKWAAEKAIELDDTLSEAHRALADIKVSEWDWGAAERECKRALELNPNYALAHILYGAYLSFRGRHDEATAEVKRAVELDPLDLGSNANLGLRYYIARRYDEAIVQARKTIELDPNWWTGHNVLGWAYEGKGLYQEALAEFLKAQSLSGNNMMLSALIGHVYAVSGKRSEAKKTIDELESRSRQGYISGYLVALIYTGMGNKDKALAQLERAYQERDIWICWVKVDPRFDPIRSDPRFTDLLRRIGFEP